MARYDFPFYVLYVSGDFWMFAVQITECVFSLKSLGLLTPTDRLFRTKYYFSVTFPNHLTEGRRHNMTVIYQNNV